MNYLINFLSILGIFSSVFVIVSKNSVHSVFFLIVTFFFSACLLLTITVDFLSIIFIVVYVGAIAVLFLFVVMMLNIKYVEFSESFLRYIPLIILMLLVFMNEFVYVKVDFLFMNSAYAKSDWIFYINNTESILLIAKVLYTSYMHIFIMAAIILLLAMLGSIIITLYHAGNVKRQLIYKQVGRSVVDSVALC